jgi:hypothetical protein
VWLCAQNERTDGKQTKPATLTNGATLQARSRMCRRRDSVVGILAFGSTAHISTPNE